MAQFDVTFELKSYYENESYNLTDTIVESMEADDLDALFELLDDQDIIEEIDDTCVINMDTNESADEINVEYVLIKDKSGNVVYRDENYSE